jgi:hypothetical protein
MRIASHATPTALIPSPIADTANTGSRRRSTGLAMTGETVARNSAAGMGFPSCRPTAGRRCAQPTAVLISAVILASTSAVGSVSA